MFMRIVPTLIVCLSVSGIGPHMALAQTPTTTPKPAVKKPTATPPSKLASLTKGMKKVSGVWTMYHNDQKLLVLITSGQLNKDVMVVTSIARGISSGDVLGGMSWGFGNDALWTFRKVGDKLHLLRRNVRFKANSGTPEANAVKLAYSDSVLYALPILTSVSGGYLIDMTKIFMSDDQRIGQSIGFRFASDRSTWAKVKAFPSNVELQVAAVYTGTRNLDTVADSRGVQVNVHYSISTLPATGYKPRLADDRIGYFLTVVKDFSDTGDDEHFVRYINRWDLQKEDPKAKLSRPKNPIRFYVEKTVPKELRPYVQEGIEEWNKAFEKLGYYKAIEVFQQRENDDWDPEDIRYNTFRWITAEAGFAMGPSRVNPRTGQILDADIIFDASFLRYWSQDYETFSPETARRLMGHQDSDSVAYGLLTPSRKSQHVCRLGQGMQQQMGFSAAVLMARGLANADGKLPQEFVNQALKEVVMHEVGHTLGLRHNFKASAWKPLQDIENSKPGNSEATVASVMDYAPANIATKADKQGLYYTQSIGPYDYWAIEYGYKTLSGNAAAELAKIAARCNEPGHDYATDEDTRFSDSDPLTNRFDLGDNPIAFAERQMKLSAQLMPKILDRSVKDGDGYQKARQMFGMLFSEYWRTAIFAARFPGGVHVHRDHKGDKNGRPPFRVVDVDQQRAAMKLLSDLAFSAPQYDPKTLNYLAATRWSHWGMRSSTRLDYPIHETVLMMQDLLLGRLMNSYTLARLHDSELKVAADADAYTLAEHLKRLVDTLFTEWTPQAKAGKYTNRKCYISSFRRNLQRRALKRFAALVTAGSGLPEDARTLARMHLVQIDANITALLEKKDVELDDYSRAHLLDSRNRIRQVLNAELDLRSID